MAESKHGEVLEVYCEFGDGLTLVTADDGWNRNLERLRRDEAAGSCCDEKSED